MSVWIVTEFDCDNALRIVAAYHTEPLAKEHVALMGGYIDEQEVRSALHADATDPVKQQERAAEQDAARRTYLVDRSAFENERISSARPSEARGPNPLRHDEA